jgi:hypothetical protein
LGLRRSLILAQRSVITREFSDAYVFAERVCQELKLVLSIPGRLRDCQVGAFSDLPFAYLVENWTSVLRDNGLPEPSVAGHASNLAHWTQLVRAFADPESAVAWARDKVIAVTSDFPKSAADIECGRNRGDVLDPYILAATQVLLYRGDFQQAIGATVAHKAVMILEGLMGHMHEEVLGRMRGNIKNPEPRGENQELYDPDLNPFPGADIVQPPAEPGQPMRIHQVKSKTGSMNASGGARLAEQMRQLRLRYQGAEIYSHSIVGNTLRGHRTMGGMRKLEPALIVTVGEASFRILTGSPNGAELLLRLYQNAFQLASEATGYSIEEMAAGITHTFHERAEAAHEGFLELLLHQVTRGDTAEQDSRAFQGGRSPKS